MFREMRQKRQLLSKEDTQKVLYQVMMIIPMRFRLAMYMMGIKFISMVPKPDTN